MNNTKIEWCDASFNPISGCLNDCPYCYARKIANRFDGQHYAKNRELNELPEPMRGNYGRILSYPYGFKPTFHKYRLSEPQKWKKPRNIFVCSFLTKSPENMTEKGFYRVGENMWYGTTVTKESEVSKFNYLPALAHRFVSIEPIMEDLQISELHPAMLNSNCGVHWVIIGAETGNRKGKIIPKSEWIAGIVFACDEAGIPVFMKDSLVLIVGEENMRREFPQGLQNGI